MTQRGRLCVSVAAPDAGSVLAAVMPAVHLVDVVEIRLDAMKDPHIAQCIADLPCPVLVTNRPQWEGGLFMGSEEERIHILCQAIQAGARYVDVELGARQDLRRKVQETARHNEAEVILSSHDYLATPPSARLKEILAEMITAKADIGKIVTTATTAADVLRILALHENAAAAHFPLCAFTMGEAGRISRLATLYLGGFMTYAAIDQQQVTAPGQISIADLHTLCTLLEAE
ncbi:type I 3-dehydroquinate dehydratase [Desulfobulbus alkaliphilus]|uniref:type I 3-dehydroquinate dehydratase n=1 Tax=Desulfobulbus alkaliphilus TaxID=869814 RepID=UPI0019655E87|nr:type I 3-dehydroquinate dehydratase [Desulfobulbus alkaliphilus]MBM9536656.1 type I 3-dehydroquinate dehydratase [Desulfobulbus alkaliphilus]